MARPIRHRPTVRRWAEETSQGFDEYYAKRLAETERLEHLAEVAPPHSERCREPKKHRMRDWDRCGLCADQLPLPGMQDLVVLAESVS